jgi:hypothetical protein
MYVDGSGVAAIDIGWETAVPVSKLSESEYVQEDTEYLPTAKTGAEVVPVNNWTP